MQIAILTLDGFNELDSFIAAGLLNRMKSQGWAAHITCPTPEVTSMAGVTIPITTDPACARRSCEAMSAFHPQHPLQVGSQVRPECLFPAPII